MKTNKILDKMVANGVLEKIAKNLGLHQVPTIKYVYTHESYVMATGGNMWTKGSLFTRTITRTEANYEILVNYDALLHAQKSYALMTLNPKAMYDITLVFLRHECRHAWQYQEGFFVGKVEESFKFSFEGHGCSDEERDANEYAINASKTKRMRSIAVYSETTQRRDMFSNVFGPSEEEREAAKEMIAAYNPLLSFVLNRI